MTNYIGNVPRRPPLLPEHMRNLLDHHLTLMIDEVKELRHPDKLCFEMLSQDIVIKVKIEVKELTE